jgi:hypothetical protein
VRNRTLAEWKPSTTSYLERDEAEAVVAAFGKAEEDLTSRIDPRDPVTAARVMTYTKRHVRLMFLLRSRGAPPRSLWKLAGFIEPDTRRALSGEEALRRLLSHP